MRPFSNAERTIFKVVEIFPSLQGEGAQTGRPVWFIRLAGCNLRCEWCDTDWTRGTEMVLGEIFSLVREYPRSVIITGGEPLIQPGLRTMVSLLRERGRWVGLETNGTLPFEFMGWDYASVSPKTMPKREIRANECRVVMDPGIVTVDYLRKMRKVVRAEHYYLSPCEMGGKFNIKKTMEMLGMINRKEIVWRLSIQSHKLAKMR